MKRNVFITFLNDRINTGSAIYSKISQAINISEIQTLELNFQEWDKKTSHFLENSFISTFQDYYREYKKIEYLGHVSVDERSYEGIMNNLDYSLLNKLSLLNRLLKDEKSIPTNYILPYEEGEIKTKEKTLEIQNEKYIEREELLKHSEHQYNRFFDSEKEKYETEIKQEKTKRYNDLNQIYISFYSKSKSEAKLRFTLIIIIPIILYIGIQFIIGWEIFEKWTWILALVFVGSSYLYFGLKEEQFNILKWKDSILLKQLNKKTKKFNFNTDEYNKLKKEFEN